MRMILTLALIAGWLLTTAMPSPAAEPTKIEPQAAEVLKTFAAQFKSLKTLRVSVDSATTIEQQGVKNGFHNKFQVAIERPNRLAVRAIEGKQAITTVSDGRRWFSEFAALKRYTSLAAPAGTDECMGAGNQRMINLQHGLLFVTTLFASDDPATEYLRDVGAARYLGEVELAGEKCHRVRLEVQPMNWDVWITTGDRPQLRQASPDLASILAAQQGGELPEGLKITAIISYKNWEFDAKLDAKEFAIEPTAGLQRVESLFGEGESDEEVHPLVGNPAPSLKLDVLAGGHVDLKDLKDKVVILDFWATWCGPCVRALPTITKVAKQFEPQGVAFYAVNIKEEPGDITAFLKEHELKISVALDKTGGVAGAYGVEGIPQTVIVGKDGRVQVVHVGASPDLEAKLTQEVAALVAGKDLAAEALKSQSVEAVGLKSVWQAPGKFNALAGDGRGKVVATADRVAVELDAKGTSGEAFALAAPAGQLRLFRAQPQKPADLLLFDVWQRTLAAQQASGDLLWVHDAPDGLDDVAAVDFNGDGRDEVVIGFNGTAGVLALDAAGKELWRNKTIGNVWHVTSGDLQGDLAPEVVTSSAEGDVYVLDREGKLIKKLDAHCEAMHVAVFSGSKQAGPGAKGTILAAGPSEDGELIVALAMDATAIWKLPLEDKNDVIEGVTVSASRPWAAITTARGRVHVVELTEGKYVGRLSLAKQVPVAWLDRAEGAPLLVVSTGRQLEAFSIDGK